MNSKNQKGSRGQQSKVTSRLCREGAPRGGRLQEALSRAGAGPYLSLEHHTRLTSMRMKTINRKPTTAARPTSQGFRRRSEAAKDRTNQRQKTKGLQGEGELQEKWVLRGDGREKGL